MVCGVSLVLELSVWLEDIELLTLGLLEVVELPFMLGVSEKVIVPLELSETLELAHADPVVLVLTDELPLGDSELLGLEDIELLTL